MNQLLILPPKGREAASLRYKCERSDKMDNDTKQMLEMILNRFDKVDQRFDRVDDRLDKMDDRLYKMDQRLEGLENELHDFRLEMKEE